MKKILTVIVLATLFASANCFAADNMPVGNASAWTSVQNKFGNFTDNDAYVAPGSAGPYVNVYPLPLPESANVRNWMILDTEEDLDGLMISQLEILGSTIDPDRLIDKGVIARVKSSDKFVRIWHEDQVYDSKILLAAGFVEGMPNESKFPVEAMVMAYYGKNIGANLIKFKAVGRNSQTGWGFDLGAGSGNQTGQNNSVSAGAHAGKSTTEAQEMLLYEVWAYYAWDEEEVPELVKPEEELPQVAEEELTEAAESVQEAWQIKIMPVVFDLDIDMPNADQAEYIFGLGALSLNLMEENIPQVYEGHCCACGSEMHNKSLGTNRAVNTKELSRIAAKRLAPEKSVQIDAYYDKYVSTISTGESEPNFGGDQHWKDRRVDVIINGENITRSRLE